ncbi:ATP-binding protein DrrA1-3 family domain-containing protein [Cohnella faecalis]|nr:DUF4162 domain-containing protein [Cohnella faecalis]
MRDRQNPQITLRVGRASREWARGLHSRPYVQAFEASLDERITLQVTELSVARRSLLQEIAELGIEVESFEVGRTSLEDVFMKAVKS